MTICCDGGNILIMIINYYTKSVYGNTLTYLVASEEAAVIMSLLGGQKTISDSQMEKFEKLGVQFERVFEPTK